MEWQKQKNEKKRKKKNEEFLQQFITTEATTTTSYNNLRGHKLQIFSFVYCQNGRTHNKSSCIDLNSNPNYSLRPPSASRAHIYSYSYSYSYS